MSRLAGRAALLGPLLAALAVRLACLPLAAEVPQAGDANGYLYLGREYRATGNFSWLAAGVRPPLHRILIAPGFDTSVEPAQAYPGVFLIHIAMDLAACALLMAVARRRWGARAAAATGWIYALYPQAVLYSAVVAMAEAPAALAAAAALWALDRLDARLERGGGGALPAALVLGLVLGAGILTKETLLPATAAVALALLLRSGVALGRRALLAGLVGGVALLVTLPWALHNQRVHGVPILSGTFGEYALMADNVPLGQDGQRQWLKQPDVASRVALGHEVFRRALFEYPRVTARRALIRTRIALGPEVMLPCYFAIPFDGYRPTTTNNFELFRDAWVLPAGWGRLVQLLCGIGTLVLFALAAAAVCALPRDTLARVAVVMSVALVVTLALTVSAARYRHGLLAYLAPLAGFALATLGRRDLLPAGASGRALLGGLLTLLGLGATVFVLPAP